MDDVTLERLDTKLNEANDVLDEARKMIKHTALDYSVNFKRIAEAMAKVLEIQLEIYRREPALTPDHLRPGWDSSAAPDAEWKREE